MAGNIKGITIEFRGDTTRLDKALRQVKQDSKGIDSQLKSVNNALKFNPKNTELLGQKMQLLKQRVTQTENSLKDLKNVQAQMDANGVDKNSEEYMKLRREIITTESKLKHFNGELTKTTAQASRIHQMGVSFQEAGTKIKGAGQALRGFSVASAGVAASVGGLAYKAGAAADDLNTLSKQTGISTHDLQMYAASADLVDVSVEAMAKSQKRLKKSMLTASEGGSTAEYFQQLGVSVTDANGELRDSNAVFNDTIQALGKMENETQRDAIAMAIFGKSASDLNPLIEDGGATYAKVAKIMEENGLEPVSQEALDRANEFNDQIDTIKLVFTQAMQIIGTKIAGYLVPMITKVQEVLTGVASKIAELSGGTLAKLGGLSAIGAALAPALIVVGTLVNKFGLLMAKIAEIQAKGGKLGKVFTFLKANPIVLVVTAIAALALAIGKLGLTSEQISAKIQGFFNRIGKVAPKVIKQVTKIFDEVLDALIDALPVMLDGAIALFMGIVDALPKILPPLLKAVTDLVQQVAKKLPQLITQIINAAIKLFNGIVQALPKIIPALIQALTSLIGTFVKTMPTLIPTILNGAKNMFMAIVKAIPAILGALKAALPQIGRAMLAYFRSLLGSIKGVFSGIGSWFGSVFGKAWNIIKGKFAGWGSFWSGLWQKIKNKFSDIGSAVGNAISGTVKKAINAVLGKIEGAINGAIGIINKAIDGINVILPKRAEVGHVKEVELPRLAKGGVLESATAVIAGESGPEAIIPLDKLWSQMDQMANKIVGGNGSASLAQAMMAGFAQMSMVMAQSMPNDVNLYLNGQKVAQAAWGDFQNEAQRQGKVLAVDSNLVKGMV